jgi:hypothetical protein
LKKITNHISQLQKLVANDNFSSNVHLSSKKNEKCGHKKYFIVFSKWNLKNSRPPSNEEFKTKMHWNFPITRNSNF